MNNVHPIFEGLLNSIAHKTEAQRKSFLHDAIVKFLKKAHRSGLSIKGDNIGGWHFVGPEGAQWDRDIIEMAKALGENSIPINMADCIEESGIEANIPTHPLQGFADWLIAGKPKI